MEGGATTFMGDDNKNVPCHPEIGKVVVFDHDVLHEGSLLIKGRKYAVRSDIIYEEMDESLFVPWDES